MPNTQLRQHIDDMPGILAKLERIPEITTRLDLIDTLRAHALSLEPLDGVETMALSDYDRDWLVRYTYNSNAIEGSTLTLQDTSLVLEGEFVPSDSPARFVFAARGVADGMAYVREYASERRELDPELIQRIHEVTALDLQPFARGTFRPYGYLARITATRVKTADPLEIHDDLQALIDGLNGSDAHPLLKPRRSIRCSKTSIHSWTATAGPAGNCSTSCCWRTDTVPWRSSMTPDVFTPGVSNPGRSTVIPNRSAPSCSTAWNRRNARSSTLSNGSVMIRKPRTLHRHGCSGPGCPAAGSGRCSGRYAAGRSRIGLV